MISRRRVLLGGAAAACAPAFAHSEPAVTAADPVDEAGFVDIGGISQWVAIQGAKASNPAVLFLHGGPANAQSPFLRTFLPWEDDFTVINWDQRGSGKTYGRNGPSTPGMDTPAAALECLMNDAIEVAIYASRRLSKRKLILVGHSWGAMLALHVVKRRPDLFHAFCGTGFPVSWKDSLTDAEAWARAQASAAGDETTLKALDAAAQLPLDDFHRLQASGKYRMTSDDMAYLKMQDAFSGSTDPKEKKDAADWIAGSGFTVPRIMPIVFSFDARALGTDFDVPVFLIQGRDDHVGFLDEAKKYMDEVHAPRKGLVAIDGGHFACFTNAGAFASALRADTDV